MARAPGRPRQFDHDAALEGALRQFWRAGLSGTTIDGLAAAMGLSKPSFYNAYGGKESVYRLALAAFVERMDAEVGGILAAPRIVDALNRFFAGALRVYFEEQPALGCFAMCTAPLDAGTNDDVRADLLAVIAHVDALLKRRFAQAKLDGELDESADLTLLARMTQSVLQGIALRARAGERRGVLVRFAKQAVALLCASK